VAINIAGDNNMIVSQQQVETLRKALAASTEANRTADRGRDIERSRRCAVSVSQLGNKVLESALQKLLEMLHWETLCQFNIGVWGNSDRAEVRVSIWNRKMDMEAFVRPEDFGENTPMAILQTLTDMVDDFRREPKWEQSTNP
jgi:hypothetical protein